MNLMKYLRKNNRKIMAVVVVLIMGAFLVPTFINQLSNPAAKPSASVAHYGNNVKISHEDIAYAEKQLELLRILQAPAFLQSRPGLDQKSPDIPSLLMFQILFPEPRLSPIINEEIKRMAKQPGGPRITDGQVDQFFESLNVERPDVYWLLLKAEARRVGYGVSQQTAGEVLAQMIPQISRGATADQMITGLVQNQNMTQEAILQTFADLLAVHEFVKVAVQNEDLTLGQIKYEVTKELQSLDVNAVVLPGTAVAKNMPAPAADAIAKQFASFKKYLPRQVGPENPFGFGYKQPARVQLEWAMVKLDDAAKLIPPVTPDQVEEYYYKNQDQFKTDVRKDPNDPNSEMIKKLKPFSEVAGQIETQIKQTRTADKADMILNEMRDLTDANFATADLEKLTPEEAAKLAGSYKAAAEEVGKKNNIKVYTSRTGFVTAEDLDRNEYFSRLAVQGQGRTPTPLTKVVFAVKGTDGGRLGPFEGAKPHLFETIPGPIKDYYGQVAAAVRVVGTMKSAEPESVDTSFAKLLPENKRGGIVDSNDVYTVRNSIVDDLKNLAGYEKVKAVATQLKTAVPQQGWDKAVAALNKQFATKDNNEPFKFQPLNGIKRISERDVLLAKRESQESPDRAIMGAMYAYQKAFIDRLFDMIPAGEASLTAVPAIVENQANMTVYVVRSATTKPVTTEQYQQMKPRIAAIEDYVQGQAYGLEWLRPDNIIKRNNFKWDEAGRNAPVRQETAPDYD
jgi:hypothetical protein